MTTEQIISTEQRSALDLLLVTMADDVYSPEWPHNRCMNDDDFGTLSRKKIATSAKKFPILSTLTTDEIIEHLYIEPADDDDTFEIMIDHLSDLHW